MDAGPSAPNFPLDTQGVAPDRIPCVTRGTRSGARMAEMELHILRESVDLLILKALTWGPRHGYAIAEWVERATNSTLLLEEGTLYPALHRLARKRQVKAAWGASENNRRAKYYELTAAG